MTEMIYEGNTTKTFVVVLTTEASAWTDGTKPTLWIAKNEEELNELGFDKIEIAEINKLNVGQTFNTLDYKGVYVMRIA